MIHVWIIVGVNSSCISSEHIKMIVIKLIYHSGVTLNVLLKKMLLNAHKTKFNVKNKNIFPIRYFAYTSNQHLILFYFE